MPSFQGPTALLLNDVLGNDVPKSAGNTNDRSSEKVCTFSLGSGSFCSAGACFGTMESLSNCSIICMSLKRAATEGMRPLAEQHLAIGSLSPQTMPRLHVTQQRSILSSSSTRNEQFRSIQTMCEKIVSGMFVKIWGAGGHKPETAGPQKEKMYWGCRCC